MRLCPAAKRMLVDPLCYCDSCELSNRWWRNRDSDGTATAAANEDLPVLQDCQARAEGIAQ